MKIKNSVTVIIALSVLVIGNQMGSAQVLNKIKNRVQETAENKVVDKAGEATEESIDKADESIRGKKKSSKDENNKGQKEGNTTTSVNSKKPAGPSLKTYSKFDFISGEKTIFYEDFATDEIGDFPARWDTDVSGEVVTTNSASGKWFKLGADGGFFPGEIPELPDNFTIEFDVLLMHHGAMNPCEVKFDIGGGEKGNPLSDVFLGNTGVLLVIGQQRLMASNYVNRDYGNISTSVENTTILDNQGTPVRISIWRQKQRLRLYLNETKIFDLPRAYPENTILNLVRFSTSGTDVDPEEDCLVGNIRVAIGAPDMRNKLIAEGKLVTRGILFDVNSDKIRPESAGTLKSIADILKETPDIKVKIIGHTDSDGNDTANLTLSKKRSASVKNTLNREYGIDASRMETDGKGESEPVADNNTSEGKANNRKVEFVNVQ